MAARCLRMAAILCLLFCFGRDAFAYIDPGTGQQVWTTVGPLLGIILASVSLVLFPLRWGWGMAKSSWRKAPRWACLAVGCLAAAGILLVATGLGVLVGKTNRGAAVPIGREEATQMKFKRVLVIGMDGLDPKLLGTMMNAGELPNFARLKAEGTFSPLQTTIPPESPVAWMTAATGCNPGQTGVFDFIRRDPQTYLPDLALLRAKQRSALGRTDTAFETVSRRPAVWDILSERGVPVSVIRWPVTFPPTELHGRMLSGLGTPDVCGTMGRYRFFTTAAVKQDDKAPDRVTEVQWIGNRISTELPGPDVLSLGGTKTSAVALGVERGEAKDGVTITLGKGARLRLKVGAWSAWQPVSFPGGLSRACPAQVRMYLASVEPEFALYVSPPHIDPSSPAFPITSPKAFSKELAQEIGPYATLGMPEDGQAVQHGRMPLSAFLDLCNEITGERERMFDLELGRFQDGALFVVFDTSDRIQHMFWAATDTAHPEHTPELARRYGDVIKEHYRRMDAVIGKALDAAKDRETALFVLSDHGFTSFHRAVHLNTWLAQNGFMAFREGEMAGAPLLKSVDWSKTRAYVVGFCSLYINLETREGKGIVRTEDAQSVREDLARALKLWRDPETGDPVVRNVYFSDQIYRGAYLADAPDLIVGYYPGYRASWQTALGAAREGASVVANDDLWAGDHLVDAPCVPGVLLSNRGIASSNPHLADLAPTVLECLGIEAPEYMDGKPLLKIEDVSSGRRERNNGLR